LACRGLQFVALSPLPVGAPKNSQLLGLPEYSHVDVALVTSWWYRRLRAQSSDRAERVMRELERRADVVIGFDGPMRFALSFPPPALERFPIVIKPQGVYRDRDLYNYVVGAEYPGGNWTEKLRPRSARYRDADLEKLRLSVPFLTASLPAIRRRARAAAMASRRGPRWVARPERIGRDVGDSVFLPAIGLAGDRWRSLDVQCLVGLTHVQRIEVMRLLDGLTGTRGMVSVDSQNAIMGTRYGTRLSEIGELPLDERDRIVARGMPYFRAPIGRRRFLLDLRRHRVAVAPAGHGELTYRHGEVLLSGTALVCQDLSHVDMMFPLEDRVNAAFCRPDLSDLRATVEELLRDDDLRNRIARAGRRSYLEWAPDWRAHLYNGIEAHIREVVGSGTA
jgi:hypothetical protein